MSPRRVPQRLSRGGAGLAFSYGSSRRGWGLVPACWGLFGSFEVLGREKPGGQGPRIFDQRGTGS